MLVFPSILALTQMTTYIKQEFINLSICKVKTVNSAKMEACLLWGLNALWLINNNINIINKKRRLFYELKRVFVF